MKFIEYLNAKKKLVEKPSVELTPDYHGSLSIRPEKHKEEKKKGTPAPYKAPGSDPGLKTADNDKSKGFGDLASPGMQNKIKKESFDYLIESHKSKEDHNIHITDPVSSRKITPMPQEIVRYMSKLMNSHHGIPGRLVREAKKQGSLKHLITEMLGHPDVHREIVEALNDKEHGPKHSRRMVRAMNENYMNFMNEHSSLGHHGMNEAVDAPRHKMLDFDPQAQDNGGDQQPGPDLKGQDDMNPRSLDDMPNQDGGPGGDSNLMGMGGKDSTPDSLGNGNDSDDDGDNPGFDIGRADGGLGDDTDDDSIGPNKSIDRFSGNVRQPTESRRFAHNNLMDEFARYPHFVDSMKTTCENCGKKH